MSKLFLPRLLKLVFQRADEFSVIPALTSSIVVAAGVEGDCFTDDSPFNCGLQPGVIRTKPRTTQTLHRILITEVILLSHVSSSCRRNSRMPSPHPDPSL